MDYKLLDSDLIGGGKFLELDRITYLDKQGKENTWEVASRIGNRQVVSTFVRLVPSNRLLLIRQFRVPANAYVIEFPAGLIDANESPEEAALRELKEETGYVGVIKGIFPPTVNSPGTSSEAPYQAFMEVDESINQNPKQQLDDKEDIEVLLVDVDEIDAFIQNEIARGSVFCTKVFAYLSGLIAKS